MPSATPTEAEIENLGGVGPCDEQARGYQVDVQRIQIADLAEADTPRLHAAILAAADEVNAMSDEAWPVNVRYTDRARARI